MFTRIGRLVVRRRRTVLVLTLLFVIAAGAYGRGVASSLASGGFQDPSAESSEAMHLLGSTMGSGPPNLVLLVRPVQAGATVDDPAVEAAGRAVTDRLASQPGVTRVASYWTLGKPPPLRARAADSALVVATATGDADAIRATVGTVMRDIDGAGPVVEVRTTGGAAGFLQASQTVESDLQRAELLALPVTALVLVLVFRSLVAALTPLLAGAVAVVGTIGVLQVLASITEVSVFALNLTTAMGLGLAIDYSLFVLSRYREERTRGVPTDEAVVRTVATAGRSVAISGLTVAVSMSALLVFPMAFLRSFAYAGVPVVILAVLGAVASLPALLALVGDRIDALPVGRRPTVPPVETSRWYRISRVVLRRPLPIATAATLGLMLLAVPFLRISPGLPDERVLPPDASVRQTADVVRRDYDARETGTFSIVLPGPGVADGELARYAETVSRLEHVARVDARTGIYLHGSRVLAPGPLTERFGVPGGEWLSVVPAVESFSPQGEELTRLLRATPAPAGEVLVAGPGAEMLDSTAAVVHRLPWALALIAATTFVLLFLSFGSVVVPAKALVLNTLSLTATFGAMVLVFQEGLLSGPLGFTPTGMLDLTTPILMFCVAFGMSMDYEVFLLSRIKEEYDRTGDNNRAVSVGLARSGRLITAAAATMAVVLLAFGSSHVTFVKMFGLGLALAVVVDATVIRALLMPAFMGLAGRLNWWAPARLQAWQRRLDLGERDVPVWTGGDHERDAPGAPSGRAAPATAAVR